MLETLTHLITNFGYIIVALFILLEYVGFPFPGETALIVAAGFAGAGKLSITAVIIIAASAAIFGYAGGYWIGRLLGKEFVERWGKYVGLDRKKMEKLEEFFTKHGALTVFIGRFVGLVRAYMALFAGISRMPYIPFMIFNALGGIAWALIFGIMGYLFGQNLDEVEHFIRIFGWGALLGIVLLASVWYVRRWASSPVGGFVTKGSGIRGSFSRVLSGTAMVPTKNGSPRLARLSVIVLFAIGLSVAVLLIIFVTTITNGLSEYDPLVRFEEMISAATDHLLSPRQSRVFLSIAKFGSALSVALGIATIVVTAFLKKRLYMFTILVAIAGGEILNALLAYLNRGYSVFVSAHMSVRLGYLLAYDNMIVPVIVFGMLAYFAALSTAQITLVISILAGFSIPILAVVTSSFLCGIHGSIEFIEELLGAIVWLWICIGLMQFIRLKQHQQEIQQQIATGPV